MDIRDMLSAVRDYRKGKIRIFPKQQIYLVPKAFYVDKGKYVKQTFNLEKRRKENKELLLDVTKDLKRTNPLVYTYCDVYLAADNLLVAENRPFHFTYDVFAEFLERFCENENCNRMKYQGSVAVVDGSLTMFVQKAVFAWQGLINEGFRFFYREYRQGFNVEDIKRFANMWSYTNECSIVLFDVVTEQFKTKNK